VIIIVSVVLRNIFRLSYFWSPWIASHLRYLSIPIEAIGVYKIAAPIAPARTPRVIKPVGLPPNLFTTTLVWVAIGAGGVARLTAEATASVIVLK